MNAFAQSILVDTVDTQIETIPMYSLASIMHLVHKFSGSPTTEHVVAFQKAPYSVDSYVMTQTNTAELPEGLVRKDLDMYYDWSKFNLFYKDGKHIRLKLETAFSSQWEIPFPTVTRAPFTNRDGTVSDTDVMCFTEEDVVRIERENEENGDPNNSFLCTKYKTSTVWTQKFRNGVEAQFILPDVGVDIVRDYTTLLSDMKLWEHSKIVKATRVVIPKLDHTTEFSVSDFMKRTGHFDSFWNTDGRSGFFSKLLSDPKNHVKLLSFDYKAKLVMDENGSTFETELGMDCEVERGCGGPEIQDYIPFDLTRPYLVRFLYQGTELLLSAIKSM